MESRSRLENIDELMNSVIRLRGGRTRRRPWTSFSRRYPSTPRRRTRTMTRQSRNNTVTLMTVHNAKGLEFPVVFLTGMEEDMFPHRLSIDTRGGDRGGAAPLLRGHHPGHGARLSSPARSSGAPSTRSFTRSRRASSSRSRTDLIELQEFNSNRVPVRRRPPHPHPGEKNHTPSRTTAREEQEAMTQAV